MISLNKSFNSLGLINGSSPCKFIIKSASISSNTSNILSVPFWFSLLVRIDLVPKPSEISLILMSSVTTIISDLNLTFEAIEITQVIKGLPAISSMGLFGSLLEPILAGMTMAQVLLSINISEIINIIFIKNF